MSFEVSDVQSFCTTDLAIAEAGIMQALAELLSVPSSWVSVSLSCPSLSGGRRLQGDSGPVSVSYSVEYPPETLGGEQSSSAEVVTTLADVQAATVKVVLQDSLDKVIGNPGRYTLTATVEVSRPSIVESQNLWSVPESTAKVQLGTDHALSHKSINMYRGNRVVTQADTILSHFEVYLDVALSTTLDFYLHEFKDGQVTLVWSKTMKVLSRSGFISSGSIDILLSRGKQYVLGVGWLGEVTHELEKAECDVHHGSFVFTGAAWQSHYEGHSDHFAPSDFASCSMLRQNIYTTEHSTLPKSLNSGLGRNRTASIALGFVILGLCPLLAAITYCAYARRQRQIKARWCSQEAQEQFVGFDAADLELGEFSHSDAPKALFVGPAVISLETVGDEESAHRDDALTSKAAASEAVSITYDVDDSLCFAV